MTTLKFAPAFFVKGAHRAVKKINEDKKWFCANVSEKKAVTEKYTVAFFLKHIYMGCDKSEMEPSSPLI